MVKGCSLLMSCGSLRRIQSRLPRGGPDPLRRCGCWRQPRRRYFMDPRRCLPYVFAACRLGFRRARTLTFSLMRLSRWNCQSRYVDTFARSIRVCSRADRMPPACRTSTSFTTSARTASVSLRPGTERSPRRLCDRNETCTDSASFLFSSLIPSSVPILVPAALDCSRYFPSDLRRHAISC